MKNFRKLLDIYYTFFKVGLFTIGGGFVMLPILEKEIIEKKKWIKHEEVIESYSLAQSLPGVIAANTSAFIGFKLQGILGAVFAVLGVITPSIIIIITIASVFTKIENLVIIQNAFKGVRVAVIAILIDAVMRMIKKSIIDKYTLIIAIIAFILCVTNLISPVWVIIISGIIGILIYSRRIS